MPLLPPSRAAMARGVLARRLRATRLSDGWVAVERLGHIKAQVAPSAWDEMCRVFPALPARDDLPEQELAGFYGAPIEGARERRPKRAAA